MARVFTLHINDQAKALEFLVAEPQDAIPKAEALLEFRATRDYRGGLAPGEQLTLIGHQKGGGWYVFAQRKFGREWERHPRMAFADLPFVIPTREHLWQPFQPEWDVPEPAK